VSGLLAGAAAAVAALTYGYARAEDLAGVIIVGLILLRAVVAGYQALQPARQSRRG